LVSADAAILLPTRNAGEQWSAIAAELSRVGLPVLVIDTSSSDQTLQIARASGFACRIVSPKAFNHGGTRDAAIRWCQGAWGVRYVVLMTQDALLESPEAIPLLLNALKEPEVVAAYGRHLPRSDAGWFEQGLRAFNYPPVSRTVRLEDVASLGRRAAFCSNTFAAYNVEALLAVGGFPSHLILGEDSWAAMALLRQGWAIRYVAEARVRHSHDYTPIQLAQRYFDTGVFHAQAETEFRDFGSVQRAGNSYVRFQLQRAGTSPRRWLDALTRLSLSAFYYVMGRQYRQMPRALCRRLSMHRGFW
jgi:rhamnosyltransferase